MNDELKFTVISDIHYYSKKNFVDGFDKNKKPKPGQLFFSRSEEIVEHTFDCLCKNDTPDIVLISGDLTYNGERTSHDEMKAALKKLQQKGKRVYVITATHDYTTPRMPTYGIDKNDKYIEVESVKRTQLLKYYGDFGYNNAIAKHKSTMSYVAQLADGYRLFALNDDYGDPDCGFSDELMNWVKTEANNAKRYGQSPELQARQNKRSLPPLRSAYPYPHHVFSKYPGSYCQKHLFRLFPSKIHLHQASSWQDPCWQHCHLYVHQPRQPPEAFRGTGAPPDAVLFCPETSV